MSEMMKQPTLTKADLIAEVERVTELKRTESETIVETIFESIIESLQKGEKIEIRGFGRDSIMLSDRKSTRLNSSHVRISYAVFCLKKKKSRRTPDPRGDPLPA